MRKKTTKKLRRTSTWEKKSNHKSSFRWVSRPLYIQKDCGNDSSEDDDFKFDTPQTPYLYKPNRRFTEIHKRIQETGDDMVKRIIKKEENN